MRRIKHVVASVTTAVALVCLGASAAQASLLNNEGFEDPLGFDFSDVTNWNGFFGGPPGTFLEAFNDTGAPPFAGLQALELTIDGSASESDGGTFVGHVQTVLGVSEGPTAFSIWARNNDSALTGTVEVRLEYFDNGGQIGADQIDLAALLTDQYQQFTVNGAAPAGTVEIRAVLALAGPTSTAAPMDSSVLFDNASLSAVPEPTTLGLAALAGLAIVARRRNG